MDPTTLTLTELRDALRGGQLTSVRATQAMLDRIVAVDNTICSYLTVTDEMALEMAAMADSRRAAGDDTPLLGIPIAIKDLLCLAGAPTTAGSKVLEDFIPPYNAHAVDRLIDAGAVILGKTNTDEFAMGSSTETSAFFTTRNPWDLERVPGGSSGGSASAVAAGLAYGSLGTDTGGSIRQPASFCGLVGLRPTYGLVSRWGVVAYASSLDQVGPMGWTAADTAALLTVIAGHDPRDSTSLDIPVPNYEAALTGDIRGLRIGVPKEYFAQGLDAEVESAVREAIRQLECLGAEIREISLPHTQYGLPTYYLIASAEAASNLARYDGIRYGAKVKGTDVIDTIERSRALFGPEVKRRIMLGSYALSAGYYDQYYGRALKARALIQDDFKQIFETVDVIAAPTCSTTAFRIGERLDDPLSMYQNDILTLSLNLSRGCGLSLPCGLDSQGLPIGLQLIGDALQEATILNVAHAYEQVYRREQPQWRPPGTSGDEA